MIRADTITAIASPPGRAARALVRLAGPDTLPILAQLLDTPITDRGTHTVQIHLGPIDSRVPLAVLPPVRTSSQRCVPLAARPPVRTTDSEQTLQLPALCLLSRSPHSYTTDDAAELLIPGNPRLAERLESRLIQLGARRAEPGEFTARAHLAGRLSLAEAEGIAQLIAAERDDELAAADDLLSGDAGTRHRALVDRLANLLALVEAGIDFTDQEDVVAITPADLAAGVADLEREIESELGGDHGAVEHAAEVTAVLVGPPNAGKSTLFNALLGRPRAIVSDTAGTTRDAIAEPLSLDDQHPGMGPVTLIDLAGLTETPADRADAQAQHAAQQRIAGESIVIACDPAGRFDRAPSSASTIRVRTKADLATDATDSATPVCALDGRGLGVLRRAIADAALHARASGAASLVPRHRRALSRALDALAEARPAIETPELVAHALRAALDALTELSGEVSPDDVIGRVFATFCVGK
ncbi:MAG: GTPase [Planctomycetota bacterium]